MSELFSTEPEIAVLSILIQNPDSVYELSNIKEFMFSSTPNQLLFTTIDDLVGQGLVPEVNLIDSYLQAKGRDLQVGGKEYLSYLSRQSYNKENLREFERLVVNSYKARTLISITSKISESVLTSGDVNSVISSVRATLDQLTNSSGGELTRPIDEILRTTWEDLVERTKNPGIRGVSTGIANVDRATSGLNKGDLWFIAGRPGTGKTSQMCNMILNQGKLGIPSLMFSLEMSKEQLAEKMLCIETGITSTNLRLGLLNQEQLNKISDAVKVIKDLPIHIDSNFNIDLNYVLATSRRYKRSRDIGVVYLDYIQLAADRTADSTNELGRISRAMKLLANELGIATVVGSQLNRNLESREDKRPQLSDLRQSGNLEEDADIVIGLYRDIIYNPKTKYKDMLEEIVLKNRSGPRGMIPLKFTEECGKIE